MSKESARRRVDNNNKKIAQKFRDWRLNHQPRMTQEDIGDIIGLSHKTIHQIENGTTNINSGALYEVSKALGVPLETFFSIDGHPAPKTLTLEQVVILKAACDEIIELSENNNPQPPEETQDAA